MIQLLFTLMSKHSTTFDALIDVITYAALMRWLAGRFACKLCPVTAVASA